MERNDYRLVLSGPGVFREVELTPDVEYVRAGTTQRCDVRFRKDLFFASFELGISRNDDGKWEMTCSEDVYFSTDGVHKLVYHCLEHGDSFTVRYADTNSVMLSVQFSINFERECGNYDRAVDIHDVPMLTIGGKPNCNLRLNSTYTEGDLLTLERRGRDMVLTETASRYGTFCDGQRVHGSVTLRDKSFFSVANFYFYYSDGVLYCSKTADVTFTGVGYEDRRVHVESSEYPKFNRNTRIKSEMDSEKIPVLDPPAKQQKPRSNIVVQLLPALGMLAVTVLLRGQLMNTGGSQAFVFISAASISVGILASVLAIVGDRRRYRKELRERDETYRAYIDSKREEVVALRAEELEALEHMYPAVGDEMEMVREFSGNLFDRRTGDEDFLHLLLGAGPRVSAKQLDFKEQETLVADDLAELPQQLFDEYREIQDAPIAVDLVKANAVGVVGPPSKSYALMKNLVIDLCTRQYEADLKLFFVVEEDNEPLVHWARMLPHVQNEALNCRNIVCDEDSKNILFEFLYKELTAREASDGAMVAPAIVVFVLNEYGLKNHPLCQFVDIASSLGVTFVFFEQLKEFLPLGCDKVVLLDRAENAGTVIDTQNDKESSSFTFREVPDEDAAELANTLAPVYCEEVSLESALTKSISLFEMFGIIAADDLDLERRWNSTEVHKSLAAPLGVSKNKTIYLDLHDKAHGPHGLVAGTTGSGKSEILQSYILSMATLFHPYEVSFLIIDFKGGGMVNQFRDLPHLAGAITNIDGREIERSLKSIKAELQKRQRYFADADVNHISNYIKKYKTGAVSEPLPHLIIVVDEFAELKAEQPEFMKELISASRIGRSLGVHLILATQKPAGQVNEQIWSNSRFKLCLKVQSREDSNEVIKSPLAAEIKEPGRAYLQVGNNEIFELFQSAFSGAPEHVDDDNTKEFSIFRVENSGRRVPVYEKRKKKSEKLSATQLDAVVRHIAHFCAVQGIEHLPSICLPPLPESIDFPARLVAGGEGYALGVYDDPDSQYQGDAVFDIDGTNTFIVGSSQTGKTNLLQVIIRSIALAKAADEASIYILDFASMILKNFEELNHVGGVVLASEDEKLKNLFKLLEEELVVRKKRLLEVGVSSFASYIEAGNTDLPHIYVVLDNFAVFKELYAEQFEDRLLALCRDGLAYGISVIVANNATAGFGYRYMSNFSTFIALHCNDSGEYSTVFDRCRMEPRAVAGRALCSFEKSIYEFQSYLAFQGEREVERVQAMHAFVEACNAQNTGLSARRIPSVPDDLALGYIRENYALPYSTMALALDYGTVAPVEFDMNSQFSIALIGGSADTRTAFLHVLFDELRESIFDRPVEVNVIDGIERELQEYQSLPFVKGYHADASAVSVVFDAVRSELERRYRMVAEEGLDSLEHEPYLVTVINSRDAVGFLSDSSELVASYETMSKQYSGMHVMFVYSNLEDETVSYSSPALLKAIKDEKRAFVLSALADHHFFDVPLAASRAFRGPLEDGQAFYFNGNNVSKVKIAVAQ